MSEVSDLELLAELGQEVAPKKAAARTPREERIVAGFEDIQRFLEQHGRVPEHGEGRDIFERLYAVRLDRMRASAECRAVLAGTDRDGLLPAVSVPEPQAASEHDDAALLAELGADVPAAVDITKLKHVRTREEIKAAEEIASRARCADFERFEPMFEDIEADLRSGARETRRFGEDAEIKVGQWFILSGQIVYVAEMGEPIRAPNGESDARLRAIYANGTESDLLRRSLQRALYKDEAGRRITEPSAGPLFGAEPDQGDLESGTVYVLRSKSDHPVVAAHRELIHKIGVTGGRVAARIANAAADPTYLLADVEVVATYKLFNINRSRLEGLFHRLFASARLSITIEDRFGRAVKPREWFMVPLPVIEEAVARISDGSITGFQYDPSTAAFKPSRNRPP